MTDEALDPKIIAAIRDAGAAWGNQPEWLWFDGDAFSFSFGRWQLKQTQAAYIRGDLAFSDATDWKARCETAEKALNPPFSHREDCAGACLDVTCLGCFNAGLRAAQAENKKLRAAVTLAANRLARCALDYEHNSRRRYEVSEWADDARAALSPPPLSPETP